MKIRYFTLVLVIFAAIHAHAGSISCSTATSLVPDGRLLDFDSVQANTGNWYQFTATAGRSYSIEVRDDLDPDNSDLTVLYYGPNGTCASPAAPANASLQHTESSEPAVPASTKRVSIITCLNSAPPWGPGCSGPGGGTYWVKVQNGSTTTSHYVSIGVTETTIYGGTWNSFSPLSTTFIFQNSTSQSITYIFTMTATSGGTQTGATSGTLGAVSTGTSTVVTGTTGLSMNPSQLGIAIFAHNGPPGAIQAFEYWTNLSTSPYLIAPVPIGPLRGK